MNIQEAKEQVKYSVISYLSKDEFGDYRIPVSRQRPLFLVGPPGLGKTEIMAQVAEEMDIALVAYSMTHHTRQSALGLPFIKEQEYGGKEYRTTEYTMSEIIASVYDMMEATGKREGILFLDEINCISETLAPSMLEFMQHKVFGRHRVPEGWVVITAGNPPEYNNAVRDFDLATMDRLKRLDIEPDLSVWQKYARNEGVHSAVMGYLEIKKDDFYSVRTTVDGKFFVTARGWVDLSEMIALYEQNALPVGTELVCQYIHDERIAGDFAAYYELFFRYRREYGIEDILSGTADASVREKAARAPFDERITVLRLLCDALNGAFRESGESDAVQTILFDEIKAVKDEIRGGSPAEAAKLLEEIRTRRKAQRKRDHAAHSLTRGEMRIRKRSEEAFWEMAMHLRREETAHGRSAEEALREMLAKRNEARKEQAERTSVRLENAFRFLEETFGDDNEMLIFVTALTEDRYGASFIGTYGSEAYYRHNKALLLHEREHDLVERIKGIEV